MSTSTDELNGLIDQARQRGARVTVVWDEDAAVEGRRVHESVRVTGLPGIGTHPMSPIAAAERLREALSKLATKETSQ